jgi:hypothetical protein
MISFIETFLVSSGAVAGFRGEDAERDEAGSDGVANEAAEVLSAAGGTENDLSVPEVWAADMPAEAGSPEEG